MPPPSICAANCILVLWFMNNTFISEKKKIQIIPYLFFTFLNNNKFSFFPFLFLTPQPHFFSFKFHYKCPSKNSQLSNSTHLPHPTISLAMHMANLIVILFLGQLSLFLHQSSAITTTTYNVLDLGANPDGATDSASALSTAWSAACASTKPSTIHVPQGRFLLKTVQFRGPCKNNAITVQIDGTLIAPADYNTIGNAGNWLIFEEVDGVSVRGGTLDGQGAALWECKKSRKNCPSGATVRY